MVSWSACAAALTFVLLAGCAGDAAEDPGALGLPDQPLQAGKGAIVGVVVDEGIRPIAGANVTLGLAGAAARTDANGRFAFTGLAPGFYALTATAPGFFPIQATADVAAGETAKARIQLLADHTPRPYHQTVKFHGYIELWAGIAQFFVEDAADDQLGNGTALCQCIYRFTPDADLAGIVFEAVWSEAMPHPAGESSFYALVSQAGSDMFESEYCTSPCRYDVSLKDYAPGPTEATLQGPDEFVSFGQDYDLFLTLFYRAPQPDGWSFVAGDA